MYYNHRSTALAYTIFRICDDDLPRRDTVLLFDTLVWRVVPNGFCPAVRHTCQSDFFDEMFRRDTFRLFVKHGGNSSDMGRGGSPVVQRRTRDRNVAGLSPGRSGGKLSSPGSIFCASLSLSCIRSTQQHTLIVERNIIPHSALLLRHIHYGQRNMCIIITTTRHSLRTK